MRRDQLAYLLASAASHPWALDERFMRTAMAAGLQALRGGGAHMLGVARVEDSEIQSLADQEAPDAAAISPATERAAAKRIGSVAHIPVRGVISNRASFFDLFFGTAPTTPAGILARATAAVADESIKAVILEYDSPGGVVTGVQECFDGLLALRGKKPLIAQVSGTCASAAYWLASAQDEVVATPTALVGSVGVYMTHEDWSKFYEEMGVVVTFVQQGKFKTEGSDSEPLSPEAFAHMQEMVDDFMTMFVGAVARGRATQPATVRGERYGEGRVFTAARAMERGMVDKVRTFNDTLLAYGVDPFAPPPEARRGRSLALARLEVEAMER